MNSKVGSEGPNLSSNFHPNLKVAPLTSRSTRTHGFVARTLQVAADVAYARIQQALVVKVPTEEVLDAPEATSCDGTFLRAWGRFHGCGGCRGLEWADEAAEEAHASGKKDDEEWEEDEARNGYGDDRAEAMWIEVRRKFSDLKRRVC